MLYEPSELGHETNNSPHGGENNMERNQSRQPQRGRLVVVGQEEIKGSDGTRITYHTEYKSEALVMSDSTAKAFLAYKGDKATRKKLKKIVANARPDLVNNNNGNHE